MDSIRFGVELRDGALGLRAPGIALEGGRIVARVLLGAREEVVELVPRGAPTESTGLRRTPLGPERWRSLHWTDARGIAMTWTVGELAGAPGATVRSTFHNRGAEPVRLREISLCRTAAGGLRCDGDAAAWWLSTLTQSSRCGDLATVLPSVAEQMRRRMASFAPPPGVPGMPPLPPGGALPGGAPPGAPPFPGPALDAHSTDGRWRSFPDFLTLYTDGGRRGLVMAAVGPALADVRFDCQVEAGAMLLDVVCEMTDVLVAPGESRDSEEVLILAAPYQHALESALGWVAATQGRRTHRGAVLTWMSWYDRGRDVTADRIGALADWVAAHRDMAPLDVIQIDDGYQRAVGDWAPNDHFPGGWAPLVARIRSARATPGIWLAPLIVDDALGHFAAHPEWFQHDAGGAPLRGAPMWGPSSHLLDPTNPGAADFIRGILRQARAAGFGYYKIDFNLIGGMGMMMGAPSAVRFFDPSRTRLQVLRDLYGLYREEIGEEGYLLACTWGLSRGVVGFADASRIGPDADPRWSGDGPFSLLECIRTVGASAPANRVLFANDPDAVYTRPRGELTSAETRTWLSFAGLLGGMTCLSDPLMDAGYADAARELELLAPASPEPGRSFAGGVDREHRRFGFVARRPFGDFATVLVWNPADTAARVEVDPEGTVAAELGRPYHLWSLWDGEYLGEWPRVGETPAVRLPAHGCAVVRLTAVADEPALPLLLGSDLHIGAGAAEVAAVAATPRSVRVILGDAGARAGNLWFRAAGRPFLESCTGLAVGDAVETAPGIWRVPVHGRERRTRQQIVLGVSGG